jgi:hypothetical protein
MNPASQCGVKKMRRKNRRIFIGARQLLGGDMDGFLQVADFLLQLAFGLFLQALGFLFRAVDQIANFLLDFAADVFQFSFNLVFVHDDAPLGAQAGVGLAWKSS